jgi:hypothetical protein
MGKKRQLFCATALVGLGAVFYGVRNPVELVRLAEKIPFAQEVRDSSAIEGSAILRKAPDKDGVTRFTYAYAKDARQNWLLNLTSGIETDQVTENIKKAVDEALKDVSSIANIEFTEAKSFDRADIKVSKIKSANQEAGRGYAAPLPLLGGNLLVKEMKVYVIDDKELRKSFDCHVENSLPVCEVREATKEEMAGRLAANDRASNQLLSRMVKHELLHVLGYKHAQHLDPSMGSMKKLSPELLGDFSNTLMIYEATYSERPEGDFVPLGKLDKAALVKSYGKAKKLPSK